MTVFIPTNAAFEAISSTTATLTQAQLQDVLTLHVLNDAVVYSPSIPAGTTSLPTVNGEDVTIVNNGTILVDQATVIAPNVVLRNGVGHVIDRSVIPSSSPLLTLDIIMADCFTAQCAHPSIFELGGMPIEEASRKETAQRVKG